MKTISCIAALASTFAVVACSDVTSVRPAGGHAAFSLVATPPAGTMVYLPIQFSSGLAFDGSMLYLSTESGFRDTYKIDPTSVGVVGVIPTGGNPDDVTFDGTSLLFSDLGGFVARRAVDGTPGSTFALPFRGGGIAFDGTHIYVGNADANQMLVTDVSGTPLHMVSTAVRTEGMVFDPGSGQLWVVTPFDSKIYELTTTGELTRTCDSPYVPSPYGLAGITIVGDKFYIAEAQAADPFTGTTILVLGRAALTCDPPLATIVAIDIKPGSTPNSINPTSQGVVPVAILTTNTFDATTVDRGSVRFGHTGVEAAPVHSAVEDVNADGRADVILQFDMQSTGIACGDTSALLAGKTSSGGAIKGADSIRTIGCK
jgi:hypothetical protein